MIPRERKGEKRLSKKFRKDTVEFQADQRKPYTRHRKSIVWSVSILLILLSGIGGMFYVTSKKNMKDDTALASGKSVKEASVPAETEEWLDVLKQIPKEEYLSAVSYDDNRTAGYQKDHVVLLAKNQDADMRLYGYETQGQARGLIADYQGTWSYFDLFWDSWRFAPVLYQGDFDGDLEEEIAMVAPGGYGTGVSVEKLGIFEAAADHTLTYTEADVMSPAWMEQQLGPFIDFDRKEGKVRIRKSGGVHEIDLTASAEYEQEKDQIRVVYDTWVSFQVQGDDIKMLVKVFGCANASLCYLSDVDDTPVAFDLLYQDQAFSVNIS